MFQHFYQEVVTGNWATGCTRCVRRTDASIERKKTPRREKGPPTGNESPRIHDLGEGLRSQPGLRLKSFEDQHMGASMEHLEQIQIEPHDTPEAHEARVQNCIEMHDKIQESMKAQGEPRRAPLTYTTINTDPDSSMCVADSTSPKSKAPSKSLNMSRQSTPADNDLHDEHLFNSRRNQNRLRFEEGNQYRDEIEDKQTNRDRKAVARITGAKTVSREAAQQNKASLKNKEVEVYQEAVRDRIRTLGVDHTDIGKFEERGCVTGAVREAVQKLSMHQLSADRAIEGFTDHAEAGATCKTSGGLSHDQKAELNRSTTLLAKQVDDAVLQSLPWGRSVSAP